MKARIENVADRREKRVHVPYEGGGGKVLRRCKLLVVFSIDGVNRCLQAKYEILVDTFPPFCSFFSFFAKHVKNKNVYAAQMLRFCLI